MKLTALLLITAVTAQTNSDKDKKILSDVLENKDFDLNTAFDAYVSLFEKTYDSETQRETAFEAFSNSVERVREMNKENHGATFGLNHFSDMHTEHFSNNYLTYKTHRVDTEDSDVSLRTASQSISGKVDWRKSTGVVSAVKNQNACGSCFAYSAVETIESAFVLGGGGIRTLSVEQIVACDKVDQGCQGGDSPTAYKFIQASGGLLSNKDYPDLSAKTGRTPKCLIGTSITKADVTARLVKVTSFGYATTPCRSKSCDGHEKYEAKLATALKNSGPASICIAADWGWQDYSHGILDSPKCKYGLMDMDHCVQVVGYDADYSTPYWIVRNSWSSDWGEKGYIRIAMGSNMCGIANEAMQVTATEGSTLELPKISPNTNDNFVPDEYEYETCEHWFWQFSSNDDNTYVFCDEKDYVVNLLLIILILIVALTVLFSIVHCILKSLFGVVCCTSKTLCFALTLGYCCGMFGGRRHNHTRTNEGEVKYYYAVQA